MEFVININAQVRLQLFSLMIQQVCASKSVPQALLEILQRENVFLNVQSLRILMETQSTIYALIHVLQDSSWTHPQENASINAHKSPLYLPPPVKKPVLINALSIDMQIILQEVV